MKAAIICYDLKRVHGYENIFVKAALAEFVNTAFSVDAQNSLSSFPDWVHLTFPDTTLLAVVPDATTAEGLTSEVIKVIESVGAVIDKTYIAFIDPDTDFLYNSTAKSP